MPVYQLTEEPLFPPVSHAEPEGLLAVGGDLSVERLLLAYSSGIFPWFNEGDPILWWSPDLRFILEPAELKVSSSLEKVLRQGRFRVSVNEAFSDVMKGCASAKRKGAKGTWITDDMLNAYVKLHEAGYAHSVESWKEGELVGGLYGVCLGRCFFGESMFHRATDASKVAFVTLVRGLEKQGFSLIDCQMPSDHLESLGARGISRREFTERLERAGVYPSIKQAPVRITLDEGPSFKKK